MKCIAVKYLPHQDNDVYGIGLDLQSTEGLQSFNVTQEADDKGYWTGAMLLSVVFDDGITDQVVKEVQEVFPDAEVQDYTMGQAFNYQDFTGTELADE